MNDSSTKKFAFVLGRERELCLAELKAVLGRFCFDFDILSVSENVVFINISADSVKMGDLAKVLGGTIKIYEIIGNPSDVKSAMTDYIEEHLKGKGKVVFGLSVFLPERLNITRRMINQLGFQAKQDIKKVGVSSRFLELRDNTEVPTILSLKEKLISKGVEFGLFPSGFGVLTGLSNPQEWSKRDYDKPAGDKFSGMLPPKLARMMANLALGFTHGDSEEKRHLIVDPFCGSGNILIEALMLGCDVFGSDISAKAVDDTTKNIKWILSEYQLGDLRYQIAQADATMTDFGKTLMPEYLEKAYKGIAFVSEPYLGEPKKFKPTMNAVRGEYRKVKSIYLKFFENIASLNLPKNSVFCLVFPLVETLEGKRFSLYEESVDEISKIGYTQIQSPLIYGRDYQVVKREISLLTLN